MTTRAGRRAPTEELGDERAHQVVVLHRDGMSERAIARSLKIGRNTVRGVLARHKREREEGPARLEARPPSGRPTKLDGTSSPPPVVTA